MRGNEGKRLHALAREALGDARGFVRWADAPDALLVSDAGRHALPEKPLNALRDLGFRVWQRDDLTWLDAPDDAYARALAARWRDKLPVAAPLALRSLCDGLLRQPCEQADTPDARRMIRSAWQALSGEDARAWAWADHVRAEAAIRMREHMYDGLYACGVLLAQYLAARQEDKEASR